MQSEPKLPDPALRRRLGFALAAVLLLLLLANHLVQQQAASDRLRGLADAARLAEAGPQRIVYPVGALPVLQLPGGQSRAVRSLIRVREKLTYGDFLWNDTAPAPGQVWIRVDLARQLISVFRGQDEIGTAVILYGAPEKPTPRGTFQVIGKAVDHYSRSYDAPMPFMLRLTSDGVAIHASPVRANGATHGCLGVPRQFAEQLYSVAATGTKVFILDER